MKKHLFSLLYFKTTEGKSLMKKHLFSLLFLLTATGVKADVILASTTSTQNSGFYDYLIPILEEAVNDTIKVVAVGTGQALTIGENGDADLLIVHAPDKEIAFVEAGYGVDRQPFMYNQFVIIGPKTDPAKVNQAQTADQALNSIYQAKQDARFVSRGDNSGTHFKEKALWQAAGIVPEGSWYRESGSGMGATLNIAAASDAYTLSDSSTWLKFANKQNLTTVFSGDPVLFNQYSVIIIPSSRHAHSKEAKAREIAQWLVSPTGQQAINSYQINGQQAFIGNAKLTD